MHSSFYISEILKSNVSQVVEMDKDSPLVCKVSGSIITFEKKHKWEIELNTQTGMVNSWKVTVKFVYNINILIQLKVGSSHFL